MREIPGIGEAAITEVKLVRAAALRLMRGEVLERPVLSSWSQVLDYCRASMGFASKEQFRILFLDKRNQIIADEVQQTGTVDHTPVYVREVVKRALELSATAIVLVHNHPSGDPTPSRADIEMTKQILAAAKPLGVLVHDHIIVEACELPRAWPDLAPALPRQALSGRRWLPRVSNLRHSFGQHGVGDNCREAYVCVVEPGPAHRRQHGLHHDPESGQRGRGRRRHRFCTGGPIGAGGGAVGGAIAVPVAMSN